MHVKFEDLTSLRTAASAGLPPNSATAMPAAMLMQHMSRLGQLQQQQPAAAAHQQQQQQQQHLNGGAFPATSTLGGLCIAMNQYLYNCPACSAWMPLHRKV
jgi:hypothetical protein